MLAAFIWSLSIETSAEAQGDPCSGPPVAPEADGFITGTPGPDVLIGTPDTDLVKGKGGDDVLCGLGAPDALLGGRGNDTLHGGHGKDDIWPGTGNDRIFGEANGAIVVYRDDPGPISVDIGAGVVKEPAGSDALFDVKGVLGTPEADTMLGSNERDTFIGGDGRDLMRGLGGPDRLAGTGGRDTARGGAGRDLCGAEIERGCERSLTHPLARTSQVSLSKCKAKASARLAPCVAARFDRWRDLNPRPPGYEIAPAGSVGRSRASSSGIGCSEVS
jgi:RTX calcium-binding nonapeptide repeat (4 copies)